MNNKKKKIKANMAIIISCIVVFLVVAIGVVILSVNKIKNKNNDSNKTENKPALKEEGKAKELLYNNYLISYILEGDVEIGEGTLGIEGDPNVYYAVVDSRLQNIHSLSDIYSLIDNNLFDEAAIRARKLMESAYANQYVSSGDTLYVKKMDSPCAINENEPLDKDKIEYNKIDDNIYAIYDTVPFQGYYDDENNLKAYTLWFACSDNFSNTEITKDSVYNPD